MPTQLAPSHFTYYSMLHRKRLWFAHLARAFSAVAATTGGNPAWEAAKRELDREYASLFLRLPKSGELGLVVPLRLQDYLDDTPVDSFLATLADKLDAYEAALFELMLRFAPEGEWLRELELVSRQWGREIAQECLLRAGQPGSRLGRNSVRGLYELLQSVLQGGIIAGSNLLLRRYTDDELQYEMRNCAHRRHSSQVADLACRLEGMVYRSFAQALAENLRFKRHHREQCVDEVRLGAKE